MIEGIFSFIKELKIRNESLFYFGLFCLSLSIVFIVFTKLTTTQVHGVNAWFKPFKFAVSIGLFAWTMAWYCHYLSNFNPTPFNWTVIILFGFELAYIAFQAFKGQLSHFNFDTPLYSILYSLMGLASSEINDVIEDEVVWKKYRNEQYFPFLIQNYQLRTIRNNAYKANILGLYSLKIGENNETYSNNNIGISSHKEDFNALLNHPDMEDHLSRCYSINSWANVQSEILRNRIIEIIMLIEKEIKIE